MAKWLNGFAKVVWLMRTFNITALMNIHVFCARNYPWETYEYMWSSALIPDMDIWS
jgi:hypothetical protein